MVHEKIFIFVGLAVSFIGGCICTGLVTFGYYRKRSESDRQLCEQYRTESEQLEKTVAELREYNSEQQSVYNELAANQRKAVEGLSESFRTIEKTDDAVSAIRQSVSAIRTAVKILEASVSDYSNSVGGTGSDGGNTGDTASK